MIDHRAVSRYARALLGLAEETGQWEAIDSGLTAVRQLLEKHPEITHLVMNSTIGKAEKEDFLDKVLPASTPRLIADFLKLIVAKGRFHAFRFIQEEFHRLSEEKRGIREVTAVSAVPLPPEAVTRLTALLKKKFKSEIRLITETDPRMIGGLVVRFGGKEIDASYRSRLHELKQNLKSQ
ncbi:MAG TPA: ATP synthase F1 subunit delta [Verrucomicrobiae bacterium]|jgi:F-type H+-transporting ATPase subunit delta|nr:ATP synthase F1 subunit delta [Verrucomicrobiae bacterium]